ncbi:right-handed parallel beta-helix repeat-containing protein [Desulfurobacterium sp.]
MEKRDVIVLRDSNDLSRVLSESFCSYIAISGFHENKTVKISRPVKVTGINGKRAYVTSGKFEVSSRNVVFKNIVFSGKSKVILKDAEVTFIDCIFDASSVFASERSNVSFYNTGFEGKKFDFGFKGGKLNVINCEFNGVSDGIFATDSTVFVKNCMFMNSFIPMAFAGRTVAKIQGIKIKNCYCGVEIEKNVRCEIDSSEFENIETWGCKLSEKSRLSIKNCRFIDTKFPVDTSSQTFIKVVKTTITGARTGLLIDGCAEIRECLFSDNETAISAGDSLGDIFFVFYVKKGKFSEEGYREELKKMEKNILTIDNCLFENNEKALAVGMYFCRISDSRFKNNITALDLHQNAFLTVSSTYFDILSNQKLAEISEEGQFARVKFHLSSP